MSTTSSTTAPPGEPLRLDASDAPAGESERAKKSVNPKSEPGVGGATIVTVLGTPDSSRIADGQPTIPPRSSAQVAGTGPTLASVAWIEPPADGTTIVPGLSVTTWPGSACRSPAQTSVKPTSRCSLTPGATAPRSTTVCAPDATRSPSAWIVSATAMPLAMSDAATPREM